MKTIGPTIKNNFYTLIDFQKEKNKISVIDTEKNKSYTYSDLETLINSYSNFLINKGIVKGQRISIISFNSVEMIALYFAIIKIGAVAVLISPKLSIQQIEFVLKDSRSDCLISDKILDFNVDHFIFQEILEDLTEVKTVEVDFEDPCAIIYTSGSTGFPKGVILSHGNHRWIIEKKTKNKNAEQMITMVSSPMCHMNGLSTIEVVLASHATAVVFSKFDPAKYIDCIRTHKVTQISAVPTLMSLILAQEINKNDVSSVRHIILASAPTSEKLYDRVKKTFFNAKVFLAYGLSEVGPGLFGPHPDGLSTPEMSVGFPIQGIDYRLIDGVLQIKSPSSMIDYTKVDKNQITEDGFFITKDLFRLDENGFYYFVGRADDMFTCGGYNVYPRSIEIAIESHDSVQSSMVLGLDDEVKGKKPYAFVIVKDNLTELDLKQYLSEKLESYQIPRRIWFIDSFPLNPSNKIDKNILIEKAKHLNIEKEL
jgi:long-chain acyl-CoA synthetase